MDDAHAAIDAALESLESLRRQLRRRESLQVTSVDEKQLVQATAHAWFNNFRSPVAASVGTEGIASIDSDYTKLIEYADRATRRERYRTTTRELRAALRSLRSSVTAAYVAAPELTDDACPNFARIVSDPAMVSILESRWGECSICVNAAAPLAATVVMGGLIEALLLSRILKEVDKSKLFKTAAAPKSKDTSKPLPLSSWTLKHYIEVAHEMQWITISARDIGVVLRDYRNYIHPQKQLSHSVILSQEDSRLLWEVAKAVTRQLVE